MRAGREIGRVPIAPVRKLAALTMLAALIGGCGSQGRAQSASGIRELAARMRADTTQSTQLMSHGVADAHAGLMVNLGAAYVACRLNSTELRYSRTMAVRPGQRTTVPTLADRLVTAMRIIGWQVRSVNMADMAVPLGAAPHPLYYISHVNATGAMNILPYPDVGAQAIIVLNSRCFDAESLYQTLEHEGQAHRT